MRFFDWVWWRFGWGGYGNSGDTHYDEHGAWICLNGSLWWLKERVAYTWREIERSPPAGTYRHVPGSDVYSFSPPEEGYEGCPHPHCDSSVLHKPGECEYCDAYPKRQRGRVDAGVNFTGESDPGKLPCPSTERRSLETINRWPGNRPKAAT